MSVLILVDDETCVSRAVTLQQLIHAVLDGFNTVLVVFDDHDDLGCGTAGEGRRLIDGNGVKLDGETLAPKTYNLPGAMTGEVVSMTTDGQGRMWMLTSTGQLWRGASAK